MANSQETNVNLKINRVPDKATLEDMIANNQIQPNQLYMLPSELGSGVVTMQTKVLWENPNPTSAFAQQQITTLDMTEYDYIQIFYGLSTGYSDNNQLSVFIERGKDSVLNCIQWFGQGYTSWTRTVTYTSSTKIDFTDAIYGSGSNQVDNKICVPLKIIGIKLIESPTQITNKYSTEETVVGEWIDGKKIYRKVWHYSTSTSISYNSWTSLGISISNVDKIINGSCIADLGNYYPLVVSADLRAQATRNGTSAYCEWLILEYTKTTD